MQKVQKMQDRLSNLLLPHAAHGMRPAAQTLATGACSGEDTPRCPSAGRYTRPKPNQPVCIPQLPPHPRVPLDLPQLVGVLGRAKIDLRLPALAGQGSQVVGASGVLLRQLDKKAGSGCLSALAASNLGRKRGVLCTAAF